MDSALEKDEKYSRILVINKKQKTVSHVFIQNTEILGFFMQKFII